MNNRKILKNSILLNHNRPVQTEGKLREIIMVVPLKEVHKDKIKIINYVKSSPPFTSVYFEL